MTWRIAAIVLLISASLSGQLRASSASVSSGTASTDARTPIPLSAEAVMIEGRLQVELCRQLEAFRAGTLSKQSDDFAERLEFIADSEGKFLNHLSLYVGIASGVITVLVGMVLWWFGRSKREAVEDAARSASERVAAEVQTRVLELAQQKVSEIVEARVGETAAREVSATIEREKIQEKVMASANTVLDDMVKLRDALMKKTEEELAQLKEEAISYDASVIRKAMGDRADKAVEEALAIMGRIEALEAYVETLKRERMFTGLRSSFTIPMATYGPYEVFDSEGLFASSSMKVDSSASGVINYIGLLHELKAAEGAKVKHSNVGQVDEKPRQVEVPENEPGSAPSSDS